MSVAEDTSGWSAGTHKTVRVKCDSGMSAKCKREWSLSWRLVRRYRDSRGEEKDLCFYCSKNEKQGVRNNNARYAYDRSYMNTIDSVEKAYLLGWIASDGSIRRGAISISIHSKDEEILHLLKRANGIDAPIRRKAGRDMVGLTVSSQEWAEACCRHLGIVPGPKHATVKFPNLPTKELGWAFLRGYFDGDGHVSKTKSPDAQRRKNHWPYPVCTIASNSLDMIKAISLFSGVPACISPNGPNFVIEWRGTRCIDLLGKLYHNCGDLKLKRKYDLWLEWCDWRPGLSGNRSGHRASSISWVKTRRDAFPPEKTRVSDSGWDLHLVEKAKDFPYGGVSLYDTGLKVQPPWGWYFDLVPRSSLCKMGYALANSVGVIDRSYTGNIYVPLMKIDPSAPDLPLPCRAVQIILRPVVHVELEQLSEEEFDELQTDRGAGGFGSTG